MEEQSVENEAKKLEKRKAERAIWFFRTAVLLMEDALVEGEVSYIDEDDKKLFKEACAFFREEIASLRKKIQE